MPIYEYRCEPCASTFETLVRSSSDVPHCPECGNIDVRKEFSVPAPSKANGSASSSLPVRDSGPMPSGMCGMGGCGGGTCGLG